MAVRPYTPREFEEIAGQLKRLYADGEREILRILADGGLTDWKETFLRQRLSDIQAIIDGLNAGTSEWAGVHIPTVYQHNLAVGAERAGLDATMTAIHQEQVALIEYSVTSKLDYANGGIGRAAEDAYRRASLEALKQGMVGGQTGEQVSKQFLADLKDRGLTSFIDKTGRAWDMTQYADMVARTNVMEASKTATANQSIAEGRDLVQVSSHGDACELCEPWEGEVLSLTGATDGYPKLEEAELAGLFHPNCLHDLLPYIE